jgi:general stress protein CsbA
MGIPEILTLIFIVLKLLHLITWSWWAVFSPEIFSCIVGILIAKHLLFKKFKGDLDEFSAKLKNQNINRNMQN